jgi:1-acyl-sn-glycerol-3-phosphate acyltransferase
MWALACVLVTIYWVLRSWIQSRLPWRDFFLLRLTFVYSRLWHRGSWNRQTPFPHEGPALVISNHTCSADPPILLAGSNRLLSFLVSREHFNLHPICYAVLSYMRCVPITRTGHDPGGLRRALRRLAEGRIVCVFPEGNLSGIALNRLRPGKPGMAMLALCVNVPVYPVYIAGGPRTDQLLKSWVLPSARGVRVTVGKPIDLSAYRGLPRSRRVIDEVTRFMMIKIEELNPQRHKVRNI